LLAIIQARSSSRRFKNKVMYPIYGTPLIKHVVNRVKKSKKISKIVVATSSNKDEKKLIDYLKKNKIKVFEGDLNNVALRLYKTARLYKKNFFIRISGDSPLIDYKIIERALAIFKNSKKKYDLVTNVFPRTFPQGQSVEIIKTSLIKNNIKKFTKQDKEHVTKYFYDNSKKFNIKNFIYMGNKKKKKLSIDTKKDLKNILSTINKKKFLNIL
jgi:spore coat polysaccharide biosynthesis protein SpsF